MPDQRDIPEQTPTLARGIEQPQAISLEVAATIAGEVRDLIQAGEEQSAWERLRNLHPADMGSIVASLPRTSRDAMVRAMSPDTVAWMLRQMNPVEAGRVGASRRWGSLLCNRPSESATGLGDLAQPSHPSRQRSVQSIGTSTAGRGHLSAHAPHGWGTHGHTVPRGPPPRPSRDSS